MIQIINEQIEEYIKNLPDIVSTPVQLEMESYAAQNNFPIIGPQVGRLLYILARLSKAKRVLELGSGYGYSSLWFGRALDDNNSNKSPKISTAITDGYEIVFTENDQNNVARARDYIGREGIRTWVDYRHGDGLQQVDYLKGKFDIIFLDLEKYQYPTAYHRCIGLLNDGGLLIADNTLWHGRVVEEIPISKQRATTGIQTYNKLVMEDKTLLSVLLPLRDGVMVSMKK